LYGALVVLPRKPPPEQLDLALPVHTFSGRTAIGTADGVEQRTVAPGTFVRLRLLNTDSGPHRFALEGMRASVVAIDGAEIAPSAVPPGQVVAIGGGGRYDLVFSMPNVPVGIDVVGARAQLVLSPDGGGPPPEGPEGPAWDPGARAAPGPAPLRDFDRSFVLKISKHIGFLDGRPGRHWALNGKLYPRTPMFMVAKGDRVRIDLVNDSGAVHPMHLHGHHFLVLSRNGKAVSPWSTDTLNMLPHERYEVAFRADNPGLWMLHCHNLKHAAGGLTMHVMYAGAMTPFRAGHSAHNDPE
jgi:FtsP/CotA-like multicopper oxidase with cupredoxin domain